MKKTIQRLIAVSLVLSCLLCTAGCADLGAFEDEAAYYASFSDVYFVCPSQLKTPEIRSYSLSDITNSETQKSNKTVMPEDTYKYIVFQTLSDINADDLAFWFKTEEAFDGNVRVEVFLSDTLLTSYYPDKTDAPYAGRYEYKTGDTAEQLNFDGDGHVNDGKGHTASVTKINFAGRYTLSFTFSYSEGGTDREIDYVCHIEKPYLSLLVEKDDGTLTQEMTFSFVSEYEQTEELGSAKSVAQASTHAETGEWASVFIETWNTGDGTSARYFIPEDTYVYLKILNNCAGAYRKNLSPIAFRANNLLVRVVEN